MTTDQIKLGKFLQKGMDEMLGFHAPITRMNGIDGFFLDGDKPFFVVAYVGNTKYKYDGKVLDIKQEGANYGKKD